MDRVAECIEHVWVLAAFTVGFDGALQEWRCQRCGAEAVKPPDGGPRWTPTETGAGR